MNYIYIVLFSITDQFLLDNIYCCSFTTRSKRVSLGCWLTSTDFPKLSTTNRIKLRRMTSVNWPQILMYVVIVMFLKINV